MRNINLAANFIRPLEQQQQKREQHVPEAKLKQSKKINRHKKKGSRFFRRSNHHDHDSESGARKKRGV